MSLYYKAFEDARAGILRLLEGIENDHQPPFDCHTLLDSNKRSKILFRISQLTEAYNNMRTIETSVLAAKEMLSKYRIDIYDQLTYISILPPELVRKIFSTAYHTIPTVRNRLQFSITVSHVSKTWRLIALSQSELWSSFQISCNSNVLSTLDSLLPRSGNRPFQVEINGRYNNHSKCIEGKRTLMSVIERTSARWQSLSFIHPWEELPLIFQPSLKFPVLETIDTSTTRSTGDHLEEDILELLKAPALDKFIMNDITHYQKHPVILEQASEIRAKYITCTSLDWVLSHCTMIETLQFGLTFNPAEHLSFRPPKSLKTFIMERTYFEIRQLCHYGGGSRWDGLKNLGLDCRIRSPYLLQWEDAFEEISAFFSTMASLTELSLVIRLELAVLLLEVLRSSNKSGDVEFDTFLPRLETLSIKIVNESDDPSPDFERVLLAFVFQRGKVSATRRHPGHSFLHRLSIEGVQLNQAAELCSEVDEFSDCFVRPSWWRSNE